MQLAEIGTLRIDIIQIYFFPSSKRKNLFLGIMDRIVLEVRIHTEIRKFDIN